MRETFIDINSYSREELIDFWKTVLKKADSFSLRFPNCEHSTSNTMNIKYNDKAEKSETFQNYLSRNESLIALCERNLIKKTISNKYLFDTYGNLSIIYICKIFPEIEQLILKSPNVFEWLEPELPEDICFYRNKELYVYTCSHEDICKIYNTED